MDKERAKEILMSIDPEQAPREEPGVSDAVSMLDSDAGLKAWEESEREFDAAVGAKLQEIPVPESLRDQLMATVKSAKPEGGRLMGIPPVLLAAAAAVVVLGFIGVANVLNGKNKIVPSGPVTFASFQQDMAETIHTGNFRLAKRDKDFTALQKWVTENGGPATASCEKLASRDCKGCTFLKWGDNKVAMFCIDVDDDTLVHMFVLNRENFPSLPPEGEMKSVVRHNGRESTGWADEKSVYVVVGHDEKTAVKEHF